MIFDNSGIDVSSVFLNQILNDKLTLGMLDFYKIDLPFEENNVFYILSKQFVMGNTLIFNDLLHVFFHDFSCVFKTLSWTSFFSTFWRLGAKIMDFWTPLAPSWAQNGNQNPPNDTQMPPKLSCAHTSVPIRLRNRF